MMQFGFILLGFGAANIVPVVKIITEENTNSIELYPNKNAVLGN